MIMPSSGVKPMEVSTTLPFTMAVTELPFPTWQVMILECSRSIPQNLAPRWATY